MSTHEPRLTGTKTCSKCERELPVISFPVCKTSTDGLHSHCRECNQNRAKKDRTHKQGVKDKELHWLKSQHKFHGGE